MARATLVKNNDLERDYKLADGRVITLKLEDTYEQITFYDSNGKQIGNNYDFIFVYQDDEEYNSSDERYLLARMYIDETLKGCGLGRACLEFFTNYTGATVFARPNDGEVRNDGSHLTEDAPGFVAKMQEEGLLEKDDEYNYSDDDF